MLRQGEAGVVGSPALDEIMVVTAITEPMLCGLRIK